ncbi:hypothetical protein L2E82_42719 [Cichorium intybus]|uniref:Uncharacterized protein n=1 Tax=Cichorium intybus TaxID=13427 RepID=A0ACB8ZMY7_CICIN|nr:hypothetical protein L2E82_42719 [Cichorium intybus]
MKPADSSLFRSNQRGDRAPLGQDAEGKRKYVIRPYTPISDPNFKGGSGIIPMLQVSLVDILLKKRLYMLAATHPNLKVFYIVDKPSKYWVGGEGYNVIILMVGSGVMTVCAEKSTRFPIGLPLILTSFALSLLHMNLMGRPDRCVACGT